MQEKIKPYLKLPETYATNNTNFWNDEHISKQMLKAHLDPDFEGASRKHSFIDTSVKWIEEITPLNKYEKLLDIGCGPGLYAQRLCLSGYNVTGVDFSKRSTEYAKKHANAQKLKINYIYQDYLKMNFDNEFNLAILIYCDYGALSEQNRDLVLQKIHAALKPGGRLLLDVFSTAHYEKFQETKKWDYYPDGGFWSPDSYLALERNAKYPDNIILEQTIAINDNGIKNYYIWNCCFSTDSLQKETKRNRFKTIDIFSDAAGAPHTQNSPTIAVLLEKI